MYFSIFFILFLYSLNMKIKLFSLLKLLVVTLILSPFMFAVFFMNTISPISSYSSAGFLDFIEGVFYLLGIFLSSDVLLLSPTDGLALFYFYLSFLPFTLIIITFFMFVFPETRRNKKKRYT